jgi:hypothetical protein
MNIYLEIELSNVRLQEHGRWRDEKYHPFSGATRAH